MFNVTKTEILKINKSIFIVLFLSIFISLVSNYYKPNQLYADKYPRIALKKDIPQLLGEWKQSQEQSKTIIDPEKQRVIEYLYNDTFAANYQNKVSENVMLSVAYGKDQGDYTAVHKPERCYPAVGFKIKDSEVFTIKLNNNKKIKVHYLLATLGQRVEPIIYWTTYGNHIYNSALEKKWIAFKYSKDHLIGDGLLVRVSMINQDVQKAKMQLINYIESWYKAANERQRARFFGE